MSQTTAAVRSQATMQDLPLLRLAVPPGLPRKGGWIDNGPLSNMSPGQAIVRYRSVATHLVEPAYVAAKAPDALVPNADGQGTVAFHERVAAADPRRVKPLGKPLNRGGLVAIRDNWEQVCIGAMACFLAQKFAPGTAEADWLVTQAPDGLVEWTNWGDARWGVAVRDGQASASGRNALGLLLEIIRARLLKGLLPPAAAEKPVVRPAGVPGAQDDDLVGSPPTGLTRAGGKLTAPRSFVPRADRGPRRRQVRPSPTCEGRRPSCGQPPARRARIRATAKDRKERPQ